jgi:hypothetical protein
MSQNSRNQGFSYYFCLTIEGSGSGFIPLTNGSGPRRPKNKRIRRIRIVNTGCGDGMRIRIQEEKNYQKKITRKSEKKNSCFEVLDVLF